MTTTAIDTDLVTPLGAYLQLRGRGRAAFLLESVEKGRLGRYSLVGEIRTVGLTAAIAIQPELLAADPALPDKVAAASIRHGVATRSLRGHAIQLSPAFVITEAELDAIVDGFGRALEDVAAAR